MLDSGRGYHEPSLELIEGYHGQQKQPQATWSIRSNLIHTTQPRKDSPSTKNSSFLRFGECAPTDLIHEPIYGYPQCGAGLAEKLAPHSDWSRDSRTDR